MAHLTVAKETQFEAVIENSRFLAYVWPAAGPEEAADLLEQVRAAHPDATHHCWAYKFAEAQRFSDDGEPGGTAGRPMLEVLLKRELDMLLAVVVRYYGGKKLGAGGLVRAYSGTLSNALDQAGVREVVDLVTLRVAAPFALVDTVLRTVDDLVAQHGSAGKIEPQFGPEGLELELTLPDFQLEGAQARLIEVTNGVVRLEPPPGPPPPPA